MAKITRQKKLQQIERKYEKIIGKILKEYKDKTMEELWGKFDEIKKQMGKEIDEVNRHYMD